MKIRVRASNGEEIPVNKDTIIDMNEFEDMLQTKRRMIVSDISALNSKIEKIKLELPLKNDQIAFVEPDSILREFDRSIAKFNIDAITINNIVLRLQTEHTQIKAEITETTKRDNTIVDEMFEIITKYAEELNVGIDEKANYLFTNNLKELSGAVLHKLVFIYRLACIIEIEKNVSYKLPIVIDSPSGKEVDRNNIDAMMKILSRDFKDNQIIIASIYEYDFKDFNRILIVDRLINQEVEKYI